MAISPSAIEKFLLCPRQYFWTYVMGEWDNDPPGPSTTAGKKVHAQLETGVKDELWTDKVYYNAQKDKHKFTTNPPDEPGWKLQPYTFDIGKLAALMAPYVPEDEPIGHEHKFKAVVEGIEFSGIIDRLSPQYITDYKTTGSDLKYAATSRKLLNNTQRLIYSAAFPDVTNSRWITGQWGTFEVQVAERENVPSDKEKFKLHVLEPAEAILSLHKGMEPLSFDLPGKPDYTGMVPRVCDAFGKICKFADRCFPKKRKKLTLPSRINEDGGLTPSSGRLLNASPVLPSVDLHESKPTVTSGAYSALVLEAQEKRLEEVQKEFLDAVGKQLLAMGAYALAENEQAARDLLAKVDYSFPVKLDLNDGRLPDAFPATAFSLSAAESRPLVANKPELRTLTQMTEEFGGYKKEVVKKYLVENLYIDCLPITKYPPGEFLEYSHEYIAAASQEVAGDMGVASPMLVDFGKGPHLVTAQLIAHLSDREEPIKHLFLETRSAEGRACMQELTSRSKIAIKGAY